MSDVLSLGRSPKIVQDRILLGVAIFIASESVFFLAIVLAYVAYRDAGLATARANLDFARTAVFSVALFASSATMAFATGTRSGRWLAATIALMKAVSATVRRDRNRRRDISFTGQPPRAPAGSSRPTLRPRSARQRR